MKSSTAAIRYAKALFSLAEEEQSTRAIRGELESLETLLEENPELRRVLLTPLYPANERKAVLAVLAQRGNFSAVFRNFATYLIDQRRMVDLQAIAAEFGRLADEADGLLTAQVTAASAVDEVRQERLRRALSARTGRTVNLEITLDPSLIGGAIAKVGDLVFDGSLRTQLDTLRAHLMKES